MRGSNAWSGCRSSTCSRPPVDGVVEGVEQLAEGYGGRPQLAGRLVGAGVGDHQLLARRHDRVEHQLPVLAAQVALAGQRRAREHVVAVDRGGAREDAVVEPEQADDAVRHRAHRHHRADGQRAGAEVGPGGPTGEALGHQRAHVGQPQLELGPVSRGVVGQPGELTVHLAGLPLVAARDRGERVDALAQRVQPVADRVAAGEPVGDVLQPVDQLREPAGEVDAGRLPTSSSGSVVPNQRSASSDIATPASTRSRPKRQVFWT